MNVPKASSTVAFKSDELAKLLTVTKDGELYFNDKPISKEALEKRWRVGINHKVTLKVDSEATFQEFVSITDLLGKNEIKNVAIVTVKDKGGN